MFITVAEHRSSDKSRKERPTSWTIEIVRDDGFHRFQLGTHYMWCCLRYYYTKYERGIHEVKDNQN